MGDAQTATPYDPRLFTPLNGSTYFLANDQQAGLELWRTDGTDSGTMRITDSLPTSDANGFLPQEMIAVDDQLYFTLGDFSGVHQLWTSDGTAMGTLLVSQFGTFGASDIDGPTLLTEVDGELFCVIRDPAHGSELWKRDSVGGEMVLVADICAGPIGSNPDELTALGNQLYFTVDDGIHGRELWRSDGRPDGTGLVEDIQEGSLGSAPGQLTAFGNAVYFAADDGLSGIELWRTDGQYGAAMVADIYLGSASASPANLTQYAGSLWFAADDGTHGVELWRSSGNAETTTVEDLRVGSDSSNPQMFTQSGGLLYFTASDSAGHVGLWRTGGSLDGAALVVPSFGRREFVGLGHVVLYVTNGSGESRLWRTDTDTGTTEQIKLLRGYTRPLYVVPDSSFALFNSGTASDRAAALWMTDGTAPGTARLQHELPELTESLAAVSNGVYFSGVDRTGERGLWFSNGTADGTRRVGTVRVADLLVTWPGLPPPTVVALDGFVYFTGIDKNGNRGLWRSDGTDEGTVRLTDSFSDPSGLARFGEAVYFPTSVGLWRLNDGEQAPFVLFSGQVAHLATAGDDLFFLQGWDGDWQTLWRTDGSLQGTIPLHYARIDSLVSHGNAVYFYRSSYSSPELWRSDGTPEGTARFLNAPIDFGDRALYSSGDRLFLFYNQDLYSSDGTVEGTTWLGSFVPPLWGDPGLVRFVKVGDETYFYAVGWNNDGLYKTDGTPEGTAHVRDVDAMELTAVGDQLYFARTRFVEYANTLWKSDGTFAGTTQVTLENSGDGAPAMIRDLRVVGRLLFMLGTRNNSLFGPLQQHLWVNDLRKPGDANNDGRVDGGDYTAWVDHYLSTPTSSLPFNQGDFNRDGVIDGGDYTLWADNYSPVAVSAATAETALKSEWDAEQIGSPALAAPAFGDAADRFFTRSCEEAIATHRALRTLDASGPLLDEHWLSWLALAIQSLESNKD